MPLNADGAAERVSEHPGGLRAACGVRVINPRQNSPQQRTANCALGFSAPRWSSWSPVDTPIEGVRMDSPEILPRGTKRHYSDELMSTRERGAFHASKSVTTDSHTYLRRPGGFSTATAFSDKTLSERTNGRAASVASGPESVHSPPTANFVVRQQRARVLVSTYCSMADRLRESAAVVMELDVLGPDGRGFHFVHASEILRSASAGDIGTMAGKDQHHHHHHHQQFNGPALRRLGLLETKAEELRHGQFMFPFSPPRVEGGVS
jgi:hypothetical protein